MVFWNEIAAAFNACRTDPPATYTTAAEDIAPAAPISTWHPATSAAKVPLVASTNPTAPAAKRYSPSSSTPIDGSYNSSPLLISIPAQLK